MPAEPQAPRTKKPRRFTAAAQQVSSSNLVGVFELSHGAKGPTPREAQEAGSPTGLNALTNPDGPENPENDEGTGLAGPGPPKEPRVEKTDPVLEQLAADEDPRRWGDGDEDLGDWLKSQRPPHWD